MRLKFSKMQAIGNDFVVINALNSLLTPTKGQTQFLANRQLGIGCDQILLLKPAQNPKYDFLYQIFNADGSQAEQCLNGARCISLFIHQNKLVAKSRIQLETINGAFWVTRHPGQDPTVELNAPDFESLSSTTDLQPKPSPGLIPSTTLSHPTLGNICFYLVSVGNPHAIILLNSIAEAPVSTLGTWLTNHPTFPHGINVGFVQITHQQSIQLRVFERGTGETLACGSGAAAAAAVTYALHKTAAEISVIQAGGILTIAWQGPNHPLYLTGPAQHVFNGEIDLPLL